MTGTDWSDVRGRLARLASDPRTTRIFGAGGAAGHGWRLEPPLTATELRNLEDQLGVELPGEYRSFLVEASAGGAGPAYGLFPVHRKDGRWLWEGDGADLTDLGTLSQPFPHTGAFNPADGLPDPPAEADYDTVEAYEAAAEAFWARRQEVVFRPEHSIGLLYLCHLGCAYREALVVSGPARGQMWADDTTTDGGFRPLADDVGTPLGFTRWYRQWLDNSEAQRI